ncbi:MAG TPA: NAD(P)/FAD-dependent oxidoreductase, partial [Pyrinomonadaceae bacterium]
MTLALRLAERGDDVTIYEAASEIGGLASAWQIGDVVWDKHYHVTLASDSRTRALVDDLGLGDEFRWVETKTGFYTDGKLVSMSDTMEFLKFPALDIISKLRLGFTIFYASRVKDWKALEKIKVEDWLVRLSGRKTFEKIWKPLLLAKLGDAYEETSAAFIWATIQRMYAARNSGLKKEMFGYVRGGYARVLERFAEVLEQKGVDIRLNAPIETVEKLAGGKFRVVTAAARRKRDTKPVALKQQAKYGYMKVAAGVAAGFSGGFITEPQPDTSRVVEFTPKDEIFDKVILTCPSNVAARVAPQLKHHERQAMRNVRYQGIICASVLTRSSLSPYYVTNITDNAPFTGVIEMSALVDKRELDGNALIYLPKYVAPDDELFAKTDDEIKEIFLDGLGRMNPNFKRADVIEFKVSRVRQVFPLPVVNYSDGLAPMKTSLDGLYVVNSSHIVNGTLNVNETVQLAERAV